MTGGDMGTGELVGLGLGVLALLTGLGIVGYKWAGKGRREGRTQRVDVSSAKDTVSEMNQEREQIEVDELIEKSMKILDEMESKAKSLPLEGQQILLDRIAAERKKTLEKFAKLDKETRGDIGRPQDEPEDEPVGPSFGDEAGDAPPDDKLIATVRGLMKEDMDKVRTMVRDTYGDNLERAYNAFATKDGKLTSENVEAALKQANVGWMKRKAVATAFGVGGPTIESFEDLQKLIPDQL